MFTFLSPAILAAFLAGAVAMLGLAAIALHRDFAARAEPLLAPAAAALLVALAMTHLLPEALHEAPNGALLALGGFLVFAALDQIARGGFGGWVAPALAIGAHSFIDGFFYVGAFEHGLAVGSAASAGLIVHELSEAVILYSLALRGGASPRGALLIALIGAAATTPAGAVFGEGLFHSLAPAALDQTLAVLAGALLYLGAARIADQGKGPGRPLLVIALMALGAAGGVAVSAVSHEAHHHHPPASDR